jgi:hypothetical protein
LLTSTIEIFIHTQPIKGNVMQTTSYSPAQSTKNNEPLTVNISDISNPTLARLLNEVINDKDKDSKVNGNYDRVYNRHNR